MPWMTGTAERRGRGFRGNATAKLCLELTFALGVGGHQVTDRKMASGSLSELPLF